MSNLKEIQQMNHEFNKEAVLALIEEKMNHYDEYEDTKEFNVLYDICKEVNEMEVKTMDDSISRQAMNICDNCVNVQCIFQAGITRKKCDFYTPPARPERKTGKWVNCYTDEFRNMCKCSECGAMIDIQEKFRSFSVITAAQI